MFKGVKEGQYSRWVELEENSGKRLRGTEKRGGLDAHEEVFGPYFMGSGKY